MSGYCVICTEGFSAAGGQDVSAVDCGHTFHLKCLTTWLGTSQTCPQCRKYVTPNSIIPKLFFTANPDEDPEALKVLNGQLTAQLHRSKEQVTHLRKVMDLQEFIVRELEGTIRECEVRLATEKALVISLRTQLEEQALAKNQAIEQLQAQLDATQRSLQEARDYEEKCIQDVINKNNEALNITVNEVEISSTNTQPLDSGISNGEINSKDISVLHIASHHLKESKKVANVCEMPCAKSPAEVDNSSNIPTTKSVPSNVDDSNFLYANEQDFNSLFGSSWKKLMTDLNENSSTRDGSSEESAIIID